MYIKRLQKFNIPRLGYVKLGPIKRPKGMSKKKLNALFPRRKRILKRGKGVYKGRQGQRGRFIGGLLAGLAGSLLPPLIGQITGAFRRQRR